MLQSVTVLAMRNYNALTILLLLTLGVEVRSGESRRDHVTRSICGEDALLRCSAKSKRGVQYRSVIWYKVSETSFHQLTGLVMKRLTHHNSNVQKYKGVERDLKLLEESQDLILPNVTLQDAGNYRCFLSAPVGHQNQEGEVHLRVYGMKTCSYTAIYSSSALSYRLLYGYRLSSTDCLSEDDGASKEWDTIYLIVAIALLIGSLLMMYVSHTCLKSASYKRRFTQETSKKNSSN